MSSYNFWLPCASIGKANLILTIKKNIYNSAYYHLTMKPHLKVLTGSIFFLFLTLLLKPFRDNVLYLSILFLFISIVIYWRSKRKEDLYDRYLLGTFLISLTIVKLIWSDLDQVTLTLRTAAIFSFTLINLVLLIGPWSRFSSKIRKLYFYRRHLGVSALLIGGLHVANVYSTYFNYSINAALQSIFIFYGLSAFFLLFWLGLTSWDVLQKKVQPLYWKLLHATLLVSYLGIALYLYLIQKSINEPTLNYHLIMIGFFTLIWLIIAPYSLIKKIMKTYIFGWKQVHVLIYVIYVSLILHVWLGVVTFENLIIKVIFWSLIFLVLGSHLTGWVSKFISDYKINKKIKVINNTIEKDNKKFVGLAYVKDFKEGVGVKSYIEKKPIAIFMKGKDFFAISNLCAHQKGPIHQGRLLNNSVECPWHYWIYNIQNGDYLGKEKFCLPVYETIIKNGIVFVCTLQSNKENHP
jgi:methionine sulfoxide reductase heme-binding subunit